MRGKPKGLVDCIMRRALINWLLQKQPTSKKDLIKGLLLHEIFHSFTHSFFSSLHVVRFLFLPKAVTEFG